MPDAPSTEPWYAVRCLFSHPTRVRPPRKWLYEERITLWKASSWEEAFKLAESEAEFYARDGKDGKNCIFIESIDAFHLFDFTVGVSTEVWSQMRDSDLKARDYVKKYCKTKRQPKRPPLRLL